MEDKNMQNHCKTDRAFSVIGDWPVKQKTSATE
jgi:hypothetical protein